MSTPAVEHLGKSKTSLEEVEEDFDEIKLYREYYMNTSSGLLATRLKENL